MNKIDAKGDVVPDTTPMDILKRLIEVMAASNEPDEIPEVDFQEVEAI